MRVILSLGCKDALSGKTLQKTRSERAASSERESFVGRMGLPFRPLALSMARIFKRPWRTTTWVLLAAIFGFFFENALPALFPAGTTVIAVDMNASSGNRVEVFLNDLSKPPLGQPLVPGKRHLYTFAGVQDDITLFRFDPTDAAGAQVDLYAVEVRDSRGLLRRYDGSALADWSRYSEKALAPEGGLFDLFQRLTIQ